VAFGPNRWFHFEIGHIDAPLAGTLPKPLAAIVAYLSLGATGEPRSIKSIREIMNETTYISSRQFRRECVRAGLTHRNMFADFVQLASLNSNARKVLAACERASALRRGDLTCVAS